MSQSQNPVIRTGDRTIGSLQLGHYVGSPQNRVALQHLHQQFLFRANPLALTDNADDPTKVRRNMLEVETD